MFTLYKLCLPVKTGERQRRRGDAAQRSRAYLSRRQSDARGGSRPSAGHGKSSAWLGQRRAAV